MPQDDKHDWLNEEGVLTAEQLEKLGFSSPGSTVFEPPEPQMEEPELPAGDVDFARLQHRLAQLALQVKHLALEQQQHRKAIKKLIRLLHSSVLVPAAAPENLVSMQDVAKQLGISERTAYRYVERGHLRAVRVGPRLLKVSASEITRLLSVPGFSER